MAEPKDMASGPPARAAEVIETLSDGTKVKRRLARMRACDEKDEKGKLCVGHLKRWYFHGEELERRFGSEIYRCERCKTLYLPAAGEERSGS